MVIPVEHEEQVRDDDDDKSDQGDEIGRHGFRDELEEELSEGRPEIFVGDAGAGTLVLELPEVTLVLVREDVRSASI